MNRGAQAVIMISIEKFENLVLVALNNAVQVFGVVPRENLAYKACLDKRLIKEDGSPTFDLEDFREACSSEVNRRVRAGTFN